MGAAEGQAGGGGACRAARRAEMGGGRPGSEVPGVGEAAAP